MKIVLYSISKADYYSSLAGMLYKAWIPKDSEILIYEVPFQRRRQ